MAIRIVKWSSKGGAGIVSGFLTRPAFAEKAEAVARRVLADIKAHGDRAVRKYARRFDGVDLRPSDLRVSVAELARAEKLVSPAFRSAVRGARKRIAAFA